jgi:hypothetical protein
MILKNIFDKKKIREKIGIFDSKIMFIQKNANFFAENWQKSQKIVIISSTSGHPGNLL